MKKYKLVIQPGGDRMTYGEKIVMKRLENGKVVGKCECGGIIKILYTSRYTRETICIKCGTVNPRRKRVTYKEEDIINAMRRAYEQLVARGIQPEPTAFANVIEWLIGTSIPVAVWKQEGLKWLTKAGLRIEEGVIKCG